MNSWLNCLLNLCSQSTQIGSTERGCLAGPQIGEVSSTEGGEAAEGGAFGTGGTQGRNRGGKGQSGGIGGDGCIGGLGGKHGLKRWKCTFS